MLSSAYQQLLHLLHVGMVEEADRIAKEIGVHTDEVIEAWIADTLHHDMRDSMIRKIEHRRERIGLPLPEESSR